MAEVNNTSSLSSFTSLSAGDLSHLRSMIKNDPASYFQDFQQLYLHFQMQLKIYELQPFKNPNHIKSFINLIEFLAHVANSFSKDCIEFPNQLLYLANLPNSSIDNNLRLSCINMLILLHNREIINNMQFYESIFQLSLFPDKELRHRIIGFFVNNVARRFKHHTIIHDVKPFLFQKLNSTQNNEVKTSLCLLIQLYQRQVWNNDHTVNMLSKCLFHEDSKIVSIVLDFFLGKYNIFEEEKDEEEKKNQNSLKMEYLLNSHHKSKHTKNKQKKREKIESHLKKLRKRKAIQAINGESDCVHPSIPILSHLYDPESIAYQLMNSLNRQSQIFSLRLKIMNLLSRLISLHHLLIESYYSFLTRYLYSSQRHISEILLCLIQSIHNDLPNDIVENVIMTVANNFINDKSPNHVISVGLNCLCQICLRQPKGMKENLLLDLLEYKHSKDKGIICSIRRLLTLIRRLNPEILPKRERNNPFKQDFSTSVDVSTSYSEFKNENTDEDKLNHYEEMFDLDELNVNLSEESEDEDSLSESDNDILEIGNYDSLLNEDINSDKTEIKENQLLSPSLPYSRVSHHEMKDVVEYEDIADENLLKEQKKQEKINEKKEMKKRFNNRSHLRYTKEERKRTKLFQMSKYSQRKRKHQKKEKNLKGTGSVKRPHSKSSKKHRKRQRRV